MITAIFMGFLSAVALTIIMARISLKKFMGYPVAVDVIGTIMFCVLFAGTLTGMLVAVIAGLTLSAFVAIIRRVIGYERWSKQTGWAYYPPQHARNWRV